MKSYDLTALDSDSEDFLPHPPDLFLQENNKSKIERAKKKTHPNLNFKPTNGSPDASDWNGSLSVWHDGLTDLRSYCSLRSKK
jgi:hypothetical protein